MDFRNNNYHHGGSKASSFPAEPHKLAAALAILASRISHIQGVRKVVRIFWIF